MENSQLICSANQLTGFYMMAILAFNELIGTPGWCTLFFVMILSKVVSWNIVYENILR